MFAWLGIFYIPLIVGLTTSFTKSNGDLDITVLTSHIVHLEETVAEIQSQSKTQEQKYAAVLSSVLSKLTSKSDDLSKVQNSHKGMELELQRTKARLTLAELKLEQFSEYINETLLNETVSHPEPVKNNSGPESGRNELTKVDISEIFEMRKQLNSTQTELKAVNGILYSAYNNQRELQSEVEALAEDINTITRNVSGFHRMSTGNLNKIYNVKDTLKVNAAFDTYLYKGKDNFTVLANERINFGHATMNNGYGYNSTTGVFTAVAEGTYQFWLNAAYEAPSGNEEAVLRIEAHNRTLGAFVGGRTSTSDTVAVNIVKVTFIRKGESVWCSSSTNLTFNGLLSSFGGALLHLSAHYFEN